MITAEHDNNVVMTVDTNTRQASQRLRLVFSKNGPARYIGHLDLARALERALNRARLPVAYSLGFNRRPRLSLAAALPLGYSSQAELADVWLVEHIDPDDFRRRLTGSMAPGLALLGISEVPLQEPSLQQQLTEAEYEVRFPDSPAVQLLPVDVAKLAKAPEVILERRRAKDNRLQTYDLRPLVISVSLFQVEKETRLRMRLVHTASKTGRPDDVLSVLGFDPVDCHVTRTAIHLRQSG